MSKLLALLVACIICLSACGGLRQECLARKERAEAVAALAASKLRVGMTVKEVKELLGPPERTLTYYEKPGVPATWKYYEFTDCKKHQGISAPTTELHFRYGKLQKWKTYED